jgi:hypothetical protein
MDMFSWSLQEKNSYFLTKFCPPWAKAHVCTLSWVILRKCILINVFSVVGTAFGYGLDDRGVGVRVPVGSRFSLLHVVQTGSRPTQPPIQWVPGALSPEVKRPGRETNQLSQTSTEVKKMWIYTSTPPYTSSIWRRMTIWFKNNILEIMWRKHTSSNLRFYLGIFWRDWGKLWESSVRIMVSRTRLESDTYRIQIRKVVAWTNLLGKSTLRSVLILSS